ncbi:hypothetical protein GINT2_001464 [Glugoides intestinalis]
MESLYKETKKRYKHLIEHLLQANKELIDKLTKQKLPVEIKFKREKAVVPFVKPSPKSNFMVVSPISIFTKDDPILRYVPTIRTTQPSSIIWFEGTVFGEKSFDQVDMLDLLFIRIFEMQNGEEKALEFIRNTFGRKREGFVKEKKATGKLLMCDLFCSVCLLFSCGIHKSVNPTVLKFNESNKCICDKTAQQTQKTVFVPSARNLLAKIPNLQRCLIKKIYLIMSGENLSCKIFPELKLNIKKPMLGTQYLDPRQFYQPCFHSKGCCEEKSCSCEVNEVPCEIFCGCITCKNLIFCNCIRCDGNCICFQTNRECTKLCRCCKDKKKPKYCINMPLEQKITRKVSICKSFKHGLGLFAEEFIAANQFVIEYTGELITDKEAERRGNFYEMNKLSYLFNSTFSGKECLFSIDAFFTGNKSRFINHSALKPNLKSRILVSHGNVKIVFYSIKTIYKGEELLFDYMFSDEHKEKHGISD